MDNRNTDKQKIEELAAQVRELSERVAALERWPAELAQEFERQFAAAEVPGCDASVSDSPASRERSERGSTRPDCRRYP
jgi:predicted metal-dependent hydrolase